MLQTVQAGDNLVEQLEEEFARDLLDGAQARVRARVQRHTWKSAVVRQPGRRRTRWLARRLVVSCVSCSTSSPPRGDVGNACEVAEKQGEQPHEESHLPRVFIE